LLIALAPWPEREAGRYQLKTLVMELKPSDASQMVEVFDLNAIQTTTLGTVTCEISGNNTLNRAP
jgi:hypothetical protein